jgi:histone acetyltransferase (RNA polymerase elongator complex component)
VADGLFLEILTLYGKKLPQALEKIARKKRCAKIEITSGSQRTGAHDFYRRLGYEEVRRRFIKSL